MKSLNILAIETSCDDTSIALVKCNGPLSKPKFDIIQNIISSQIAIHRPFGGVVPNLAKREHIKNLPIILKRIMNNESGIKNKKSLIPNSQFPIPDYIAVTVGPGLEPALWTGINFAQELSKELKIPLIGVNHLEGHIYSTLLPSQIQNQKYKTKKGLEFRISNFEFPAILLLVSGGHTTLLKINSIIKWKKLGETLDDAAGEAFDKVARMLKLPYPGGPEIQKLAEKGDKKAIKFPRPLLNLPPNDKNYFNFSFSGLKTSVLYFLKERGSQINADKNTDKCGYISENPCLNQCKSVHRADVAASFQQAVIDTLVKKTMRAAQKYKAKSIMLCGGVSANKLLREALQTACQEPRANFIVPDFKYSLDNAAMIAAAAYINLLQKNKKKLLIEANGNLTI